MKTLLATLALAGMLMATSAYAGRCPGDVAKIDAALQAGTNLSSAQLAEVQTLRDQGEQLHQSGNHGESVNVLGQAMEMLGIN